MSIYISGVGIPKHCIDCLFMVSRDNDNCILQSDDANASFENWEQMKAGCPLIPVPGHGKLIDADTLKNTVLKALNDAIAGGSSTFWGSALCTVIAKSIVDEIEAAPIVIPADLPIMYYPQVPGITPTVLSDKEGTK